VKNAKARGALLQPRERLVERVVELAGRRRDLPDALEHRIRREGVMTRQSRTLFELAARQP
jgi:hypothetical protein